MADKAINRVIERIQATYSSWGMHTTLEQMRKDWDALFAISVDASEVQNIEVGSIPCRWLWASEVDRHKVVLYCHGGGFRMGSVESHQDLMLRISKASGCSVLGVDYSLCPEVQYPVALYEVFAVYEWLLEKGFLPQHIAIAGDSAGANLVGALLQLIKLKGVRQPAAAVFLSAWLDMKAESESYQSCADSDPIHQRKFILALAKGYLGEDGDPDSPLTSPLNGEYQDLPPMLVHVGDREVGLDESIRLADKARAAGIDVELKVWEGMIHAFQQFPDELAEASQAISDIGTFLKKRLC